MRNLHLIMLLLAVGLLASYLDGTPQSVFFGQSGFDPSPQTFARPSTRQTVMNSLLYQDYQADWQDNYLFSAELNDQGQVTAITSSGWNPDSALWEEQARQTIEYRPDFQPAHIAMTWLKDGEWSLFAEVNYVYEDDLVRMISYNQFEDGESRPYWQAAFYYTPNTLILNSVLEFQYMGEPVPLNIKKYDYIWDAGSRPSEILSSVMSLTREWEPTTRDTYGYHNDDQTTHASYLRYLEIGWPFNTQLLTGVFPTKLLEHRRFQRYAPTSDWYETVREFYSYDASNQLETIDQYESPASTVWEVNQRRTYSYTDGLPVSETWWHDPDGQDVLVPSSRIIYGYTQITAADDPVAPPAISDLKVFPNPFNPQTAIGFKLQDSANMEVSVYNLKGQRVRKIFAGNASSGDHNLNWDGRDDQGRKLAAGTYLIWLKAGNESDTVKAVLSR